MIAILKQEEEMNAFSVNKIYQDDFSKSTHQDFVIFGRMFTSIVF